MPFRPAGEGMQRGDPPFAQEEDRTGGNIVEVKEFLQHLVDSPGAAGDVEHRIEFVAADAGVQCPIECGDTGEGDPLLCPLEEEAPKHLRLVGDAGKDHRVVDIADDDEAGAWRRQKEGTGGAARGFGACRHQRQAMPAALGRGRFVEAQIDAKVAVAVRRYPLRGAAEAGGQRHSGGAMAQDPPADIGQVAADFSLPDSFAGAALPENAAGEANFPGRGKAAIRLDGRAAAAAVSPRRPPQQI